MSIYASIYLGLQSAESFLRCRGQHCRIDLIAGHIKFIPDIPMSIKYRQIFVHEMMGYLDSLDCLELGKKISQKSLVTMHLHNKC